MCLQVSGKYDTVQGVWLKFGVIAWEDFPGVDWRGMEPLGTTQMSTATEPQSHRGEGFGGEGRGNPGQVP